MKTPFFQKKKEIYCMYVNEERKSNPFRIMNLNDIYTYIKNGKIDNLPDLRKQDELVLNDYNFKERKGLVSTLPGISIGFRFTKDWFQRPRPEFKPSNLMVFDFFTKEGDILNELNKFSELGCVVLSYNNYLNGKTLVIKTDNKTYHGVVWTFPMIRNLFDEWIGVSPYMDLGPNIVPIRHDPDVYFNPSAVPFGEMIEKVGFWFDTRISI